MLLPSDCADPWFWQFLIGDSLIASSKTRNKTGTVLCSWLSFMTWKSWLSFISLCSLPGWAKFYESFGSVTSFGKGSVFVSVWDCGKHNAASLTWYLTSDLSSGAEFTQLRRQFIFLTTLNHKIPSESGLISGAYRSKWISKLSFFNIHVSHKLKLGITFLRKMDLDLRFVRGKINFHQSLTLDGKTDNLTRSRIDPDKPK